MPPESIAKQAAPGEALVSVLIPCFNAAPHVAAAIESVLAQTYTPIEIIVVDDGSTDGSRQIVERFGDRGVVLLHQPNKGAAAARNLAFEASKGHFILYLDGDDLISPEHLERLQRRLANGEEAVAMGEWDRFNADPFAARFPDRPEYRDLDALTWLLRDWDSGQPMTQCGQFLLPRHLIERAGGWDERLSLIDDFEFFSRILLAAGQIRFAPGARLYYRSGVPGSLSGRKSRKAAESACLSLLLGTAHLLAAEDSARTRLACANMLQTFEFEFYPDFPDLRARIATRVTELGGSTLEPFGPPRFHTLRQLIGWRAARRIQRKWETLQTRRTAPR